MSNIYVPINATNAKEGIPPNEDIIYSTMAKAIFTGFGGYTTFLTHILMTPNGFAFTDPRYTKKKEPPRAEYKNWLEIKDIKKDKIVLLNPKGGTFTFQTLTQFETEESFKKRRELFESFILPYIIDYSEKAYINWEKNPEVKKKYVKQLGNSIKTKKQALEKAKTKAERVISKYGE